MMRMMRSLSAATANDGRQVRQAAQKKGPVKISVGGKNKQPAHK